jgi:hypothetical protein
VQEIEEIASMSGRCASTWSQTTRGAVGAITPKFISLCQCQPSKDSRRIEIY